MNIEEIIQLKDDAERQIAIIVDELVTRIHSEGVDILRIDHEQIEVTTKASRGEIFIHNIKITVGIR